jgi:hypothetical protein
MRRLLLPLVLLAAACAPPVVEDDSVPLPDSGPDCSGVGTFDVLAPKSELHYSPHLDVVIDHAELSVSDLDISMVDAQGTTYQRTSDTQEPYSPDAGLFLRDKVHFELAPSGRYTLTVSYCDGSQLETIQFFTSAE